MPHLGAMSPKESKPIATEKPDAPLCPICRHMMIVKQVAPSGSMLGVGATVYVCDGCGTEMHRAARRS